jgi:hypothetical protein
LLATHWAATVVDALAPSIAEGGTSAPSGADPAPRAPSPPNPYPGLRPFDVEDEIYFFGREEQVDQMVDALARRRFLAVIGGSGCGKSSLVNCGLCPALHRGRLSAAGSNFRVARLRPGAEPIRALSRALASALPFEVPEAASLAAAIESTLRLGRAGLADVIQQASLTGTKLLLVIDQFEELFRYANAGVKTAARDAHAMVAMVLEALARPELPLYVVITMRSDYLGDCAQFAELPEALSQAQFLVPRLSRAELRLAIEAPAKVVDAELSAPLVTRLLNDAGDDPDQLSLLQHALRRTFERWRARKSAAPVTLGDYVAVGTLSRALDRHAEQAYQALSKPNRRVCEKVFQALTDRVSDPRGIRRPTTFGELCAITGATPERVRAVIEAFRKPARSFLTPPRPEPLADEVVIDISHESLMRIWQTLRRWADAEAQSAELYRRLSRDASLHERGERGVWRDPELALARRWRHGAQPTSAWAKRYAFEPGGANFEQTLGFLGASARSARRRALLRFLGLGIAVLMIVAALALLAGFARLRAAKAEADAESARETALNATKATENAQKAAELGREALVLAEAKAKKLDEENTRLEGELAQFYVKNPNMRREVQELRTASRSLILQILETQEENLVLTDQISVATNKLDELTTTAASLVTRVRELRDDSRELTAVVEALRAGRGQRLSNVIKAREKVEALRKENRRLRAALLAKGFLPPPSDRGTFGAGAGSDSVVSGNIDHEVESAGSFEDDRLAALARKNAQLKARLQAFQDEARLLELLAQELGAWKARLDTKLSALKKTNSQLRLKMEGLRAMIRELERQIATLRAEEGELFVALRALERTRNDLILKVAELRGDEEALDREAEALTDENDVMNDALAVANAPAPSP